MGVFVIVFPAVRFNKKCFQCLKAFFISSTIRAKWALSFVKLKVFLREKMKNTVANFLTMYLFEIIILFSVPIIEPPQLNFFEFFTIWILIAAFLNSISIIYLIRKKPKYYIGTIIIGIIIVIIPAALLYHFMHTVPDDY